MITVLRQIKYNNNKQLGKVDTLSCMLQVIEILEKNYFIDETINNKEYNIVIEWLEKYYCELKEMFIKERGF